MILIRDVMAEMPERLLDPATVKRMKPAKLQPQIRPRLFQRLEDMRRLVGGRVDLPAQLADIGHPVRAPKAHADLDLLRGAEGEGRVGEIRRADAGHQIARLRPHDAQDGLRRRHIGDDREGIPQMPSQPGQIALQRRPRHDQKEGRLRQPRHGQVTLDPAPRVQHLRIDDPPRSHVQIGPAQPLQEGQRIAPLDPDLAE